MDTNQKTQQINTFAKGMDTDTSDMLISNEAYRMANNLRYITDTDENTGELSMIPGALSVMERIQSGATNCSIYAATVIRDYAILIVKHQGSNTWSVLLLEQSVLKSTRQTLNADSYTVFRCSQSIGNGFLNKLSLVTRWYNENDIKLYIADGVHQILCIKMTPGVYDTTVHTNLNSVLNGHLNGLLIPTIRSVINGRLKSGLVQYAYVLYNKHGVSTNISPLSQLVAINQSNTNNGHGYNTDEYSNMGLCAAFGLLSECDHIKIYRISYIVNGQQPTIDLIVDSKYESGDSTYVLNDFGMPSLLTITVEEFNSLVGIQIVPRVIEAKNGYLFAGNIKYEYDLLDSAILDMDFRTFSSGDGDISSLTSNYINSNLDFSQNYDESKWKQQATWGSSNVVGGAGPNIKWLFETEDCVDDRNFAFGEKALGLSGIPYIVKENKVVDDNGNVTTYYKSLRRDEIYRYGIVFYTNTGIKYPAKFIADIRTPDLNNDWFINTLSQFKLLLVKFTIPLNTARYLNNHGVTAYEIVRVNRTASDRATISLGVVSCLVRGTGGGKDGYFSDNYKYCPSGLITVNHIGYYSWEDPFGNTHGNFNALCFANTTASMLLFFSPEMLYLSDDVESLINSNTLLQAIAALCDSYPAYFSNDQKNIKEISTQNTYYYDPDGVPALVLIDGKHSSENAPRYTIFTKNKNQENSSYRYNWVTLYLRRPEGEQFSIDWDQHAVEYLYNPETNDPYSITATSDITSGYTLHRLDKRLDSFSLLTYNIEDYATMPVPAWNEFIDADGDVKVFDKSIYVGGYAVSQFAAPFVATLKDLPTKDEITQHLNKYTTFVAGPSERSLILSGGFDIVDGPIKWYFQQNNFNRASSITDEKNNRLVTILCNLRNKNVVPYSGFTKDARDASIYRSHGQYRQIDTIGDNITVSHDGDCFLTVFECVPMHKWYSSAVTTFARTTVIYQIPVETDIDVLNDFGDRFSTAKSLLVQDQPSDVNGLFVQKKPAYLYNTAYSMEPNVIYYSSLLDEEDRIDVADYRVHYSNLNNDNSADGWVVFQPLNYIDVDSRYGQITNLRTFHNALLFWQESATGLLSVNERTLITDNSNLPLILGTGGVLDRYDYLNTRNGMKADQFADTQSDSTLYWWDYDRHEICAYQGGALVVPLSKAKNVLNYLNNIAKIENMRSHPALCNDKEYNEILFSIEEPNIDVEDVMLVYSEQLQLFTGMYSGSFNYGLSFVDNLYLTNVGYINKWNYENAENPVDVYGFQIFPYLKYVINDNAAYTKVYDTVEFAGKLPNNDGTWDDALLKQGTDTSTLNSENEDKQITFSFKTPLKQEGSISSDKITNRQYDFKFSIPRHDNSQWGDRLRGKTMQCELSSQINSVDFSLQYIMTKYRISWS